VKLQDRNTYCLRLISGCSTNLLPEGGEQTQKMRLQCHIIKYTVHLICSPPYGRGMVKDPSEQPDGDAGLPVDSIPERWGEAVNAGFIAVPNVLVKAQKSLGLSPIDMVIVLNIIMFWWHRERRPSPRSTAIARRTGLGHRTVQRSLSKLENLGLIKRFRVAKDKTEYSLDGLINRLEFYAKNDVWYRPELTSGH
jgi:DNA-binding transcriptional ArsR family regulator